MNIIDLLAIIEKKFVKAEKQGYFSHRALERAGILEQFYDDLNSDDVETHIERMKKYDGYAYDVIETEAVDTEAFVDRNFNVMETLDAYGSAIVQVDGDLKMLMEDRCPEMVNRLFVIFNTYGDEDSKRHEVPLRVMGEVTSHLHYTPCIVTLSEDDSYVEAIDVADFYYDIEGGFRIERRFHAGPFKDLPAQMIHDGKFGGKRGFYFDLTEETVSVRCDEDAWVALPDYHDEEFSPSSGNLSAPRLKFQLKDVA